MSRIQFTGIALSLCRLRCEIRRNRPSQPELHSSGLPVAEQRRFIAASIDYAPPLL
jgi:hypothetical protein